MSSSRTTGKLQPEAHPEFVGAPVLVTGAGGFVGANLVRALLACGADVHCLLSTPRADAVQQSPAERYWRLAGVADQVTMHAIGLDDPETLKACMTDVSPRFIYHLAAHGNSNDHNDVERIMATNIAGTQNLLIAALDISYRCFVNAGSSSEYGFKDAAMHEDDIAEPMSYYAISKLAATNLCRYHSRMHEKPTVTLRLFSAYGPFEEPSRFIPVAICAALDGKPLPLTEGTEAHDFVYIDDVVDACLSCAKLDAADGQVLNVCSGGQSTNLEVVAAIESAAGVKIDARIGAYPTRNWDNHNWVGDSSRAAQQLLWHARCDLDEGLKTTIDWIADHRETYSPAS
jgi:nucleoside-diphosphate-sugar epimerase